MMTFKQDDLIAVRAVITKLGDKFTKREISAELRSDFKHAKLHRIMNKMIQDGEIETGSKIWTNGGYYSLYTKTKLFVGCEPLSRKAISPEDASLRLWKRMEFWGRTPELN